MKRNTLFSFLAIAALGLITAAPAYATDDTYTWFGGAGTGSQQTQWDYKPGSFYLNWQWDKDGVQRDEVTELPTSGDIVVIPDVTHQPILAVAATLSDLTIDNGADMKVSSALLTLPTSGTTAYDSLNGDLILSDSGAKVLFSADVTIDGRGGIVGQDDSAELWITGGKTLTNETTVSGNMKVMTAPLGGVGNGVFDNRHVVLANANGTLLFAADLTLDDDSGAQWQVKSNGGAIMDFREDATSLAGSFVIDDCAKLKVDGAAVETCGDLVTYSGFIDIENSGTFKYHTGSPCDATTEVIFSADDCNGSCDCP